MKSFKTIFSFTFIYSLIATLSASPLIADQDRQTLFDTIDVDVPTELKQPVDVKFKGPSGEVFTFALSRVPDGYIMLAKPRFSGVASYTVFEGVEFSSDDITDSTQQWTDYKLILKPTNGEEFSLTDYGSGYAFLKLKDESAMKVSLNLFGIGYESGLSLDEAKQAFADGFLVLRDQYERDKVVDAGFGEYHGCALFENGKVKCWGLNDGWTTGDVEGRLGIGLDIPNSLVGGTPGSMGPNLKYVDLGPYKVTKLFVGIEGNCALFDNGKLKCWGKLPHSYGDNTYRGKAASEMGENLPFVDLGSEKVLDLTLPHRLLCALMESGRVKCWGDGDFLPYGDGVTRGDDPKEMGDKLPYVDLGSNTGKAKKVVGGLDSSCVLFENGKVKCFGLNNEGQLGIGIKAWTFGVKSGQQADNLPYLDLGSFPVIELYGTGFYYCAKFQNQKFKCWGSNDVGKLGLGDEKDRGSDKLQMGNNLPYLSVFGIEFSEMFLSWVTSCGKTTQSKYVCFGIVDNLGVGKYKHGSSPSDLIEGGITFLDFGNLDIQKLIVGLNSCVLTKTQQLYCFGYNSYGQLGLEHSNQIDFFTRGALTNLKAVNFKSAPFP